MEVYKTRCAKTVELFCLSHPLFDLFCNAKKRHTYVFHMFFPTVNWLVNVVTTNIPYTSLPLSNVIHQFFLTCRESAKKTFF